MTAAERIGAADPLLESLELRLLVHQPLDRLEPRLRVILYRRDYQGQSQKEVGERLGISQMHVSRLERQALAWLRQELHREWNSEHDAEAPGEGSSWLSAGRPPLAPGSDKSSSRPQPGARSQERERSDHGGESATSDESRRGIHPPL
jgi:Sigma-70, region 4